MENAVEIMPGGVEQNAAEEELSFFTYIFRGFIFPCGSMAFYKAAIKKKVIWAILFFVFFGFVFSVVQTAIANNNIKALGNLISEGFQNGDIPKVIIKNGMAEAFVEQPLVYDEDGLFAAIDTTGQITNIDRTEYEQGLLITKTEMHSWNNGRYQEVTLKDLNDVFGDPIYFDESHVMDFWRSFSSLMGIVIFISLWIWHAVIRFCYIAFLALVIWGIASLIKDGIGFATILISGIFANVPVMYIKTILKFVDISFFLLYTLLLLIIWGIVLYKLLKKKPETNEAVIVDAVAHTPLEQNDPSQIDVNDSERIE